ncbi:MAG: MarR family transcriptional regulator [Clostridia bacterium]|nr:MarR family transcriptional regulator [Clostridia bacterium]
MHTELMAAQAAVQKALYAAVPGQPKILELLLEQDDIRQRKIASACRVEPATLTKLLLGMERAGLVERRQAAGDRRSWYVFLTEYGRTMANEVQHSFEEIERTALRGFSEREQAQLTDLLKRIAVNMKEDGSDG